jgi:GNAT superfamily N-acetyltransferase/predicted nucleic acid-binding protein
MHMEIKKELPQGYDLLVGSDEVEIHVPTVISLADENRASFGFLPHASYHEGAARGRLWIVKAPDQTVAGYLFFGGRFPNIAITQMFVHQKHRRLGLGECLIEALKQHATLKRIQTISAKVAADLPANHFWEKCKLLVIQQVAGGQTTNRRINVRLFHVPHASLWTAELEPSVPEGGLGEIRPRYVVPNYVLDLNVFFDVIKNRIKAEDAKKLFSAALASQIDLRVTSEFINELNRSAGDVENDPVLQLAKTLPALPSVSLQLINPLIEELRKIVFPEKNRSLKRAHNDASDLKHLAICIHYRISAFVTSEKAILRKADTFETQFGLEIVSPSDLLLDALNLVNQMPVLKAEIEGESVNIDVMHSSHQTKVEAFLEKLVGLDKILVSKVFDPGSSNFSKQRLIATSSAGEIFGFYTFGLRQSIPSQIEGYIFVDETHIASQLFIDHCLQAIMNSQPVDRPCSTLLCVPAVNTKLLNTAKVLGFSIDLLSEQKNFLTIRRIGFNGVILNRTWLAFCSALRSGFNLELPERTPSFAEAKNTGVEVLNKVTNRAVRLKLEEMEQMFAPALFSLAGRCGTIVPIQEVFAKELLQMPETQLPLLPGKEAQLRIERAYFGSVGFEKAFEKDGLAVFYVSGAGGGRKEAIGLARVTSVGRITLERASTEFFRYGVLEDHLLSNLANNEGLLGMLTFNNFLFFKSPIKYSDLIANHFVNGANLVTAQRIDSNQLIKLIELGFPRA